LNGKSIREAEKEKFRLAMNNYNCTPKQCEKPPRPLFNYEEIFVTIMGILKKQQNEINQLKI
jgi:hypothetical protein